MSEPIAAVVYKVCAATAWSTAVAVGTYTGSADDSRDGFIHLSTAAQLGGTTAKYFRDQPDLVLVAIDAQALGQALWWEPSRDGQLFPHLYAPLDPALVTWMRPLPLDADGLPRIPEGLL